MVEFNSTELKNLIDDKNSFFMIGDNGALKKTDVWSFCFEKIKGLFGCEDRCDQSAIKCSFFCLARQGLNETDTTKLQEAASIIHTLASQIGITPPSSKKEISESPTDPESQVLKTIQTIMSRSISQAELNQLRDKLTSTITNLKQLNHLDTYSCLQSLFKETVKAPLKTPTPPSSTTTPPVMPSVIPPVTVIAPPSIPQYSIPQHDTPPEAAPSPEKRDLAGIALAVHSRGLEDSGVQKEINNLTFEEFKDLLQLKRDGGNPVLQEKGVIELIVKRHPSPEDIKSLFSFGAGYNDDGSLSLLFAHSSNEKLYDLLDQLGVQDRVTILNRNKIDQGNPILFFQDENFVLTQRFLECLHTLPENDLEDLVYPSAWRKICRGKMDKNIDPALMVEISTKIGGFTGLCRWIKNSNIMGAENFESIFAKLPLDGIITLLGDPEIKKLITWQWAQPYVQQQCNPQREEFVDEKGYVWLKIGHDKYQVQESFQPLIKEKFEKILHKTSPETEKEIRNDLQELSFKDLKELLQHKIPKTQIQFMARQEIMAEVFRRYTVKEKLSPSEQQELAKLFCMQNVGQDKTLLYFHLGDTNVYTLLRKLDTSQLVDVFKNNDLEKLANRAIKEQPSGFLAFLGELPDNELKELLPRDILEEILGKMGTTVDPALVEQLKERAKHF